MTELDALDLALLRALQDDARQTNRDLAAAVHVSPVDLVGARARRCKASGVDPRLPRRRSTCPRSAVASRR